MTGNLTDTELALGLFLFTLPVTLAATARLLSVLRHRRFLDRPNVRSSHTTPTPRGGGLAIIAVLIPVLAGLGLAGRAPGGVWLAAGGLLLVAAVSLVDDLRGLGPLPRLAVQAAAVALAMPGLVATGPVFQGLLPGPVDAILAGLVWIWFINLFNFMDGIDAITGIETVSLGGGLALVAGLTGSLPGLAPVAAAAAGAAAGFLWWNRPPARVFLGDVGSVPLGYLLGWLLLTAAAAGAWQAALILPLYYLADASLTLLRRLFGGRPVWRAHREHFYQMATAGGRAHGPAVGVVLAGNVVLILLAVAATMPGAASWPLFGAVVVVAGVLARLAAMGRAPRRPGG